MSRPIYEIAKEILQDWSKVNYCAEPYLLAMFYLTEITDNYGCDSAKSILLYFLSNAQTWKGAIAKRIKKELNEMCND